MTAATIIEKYISFFEKRGHKRIPAAPLIPENDPTTLFTSSGMQPLVPYFLGEPHPQGKRLVNVQNCFRAQDIDEVGDNRHTTFFRMLGNWSLGDPARNASAPARLDTQGVSGRSVAGGYFKKEQLPWFWEFLTKELGLDPSRLYVSIFEGYQGVPKDVDSHKIWKDLGLQENHISFYGVDKNWWSRTGEPEKMPPGEPGGPDSELFYQFDVSHDEKFGKECHPNCSCGRFMEIGNSVFMEYQKQRNGLFKKLSQQNVDFGGGLERLLAAVENQQDVFQTSLFSPIIETIEKETNKDYASHASSMRIITDHFVAAVFITAANITPSNKEQGYILRRLLRRGFDNLFLLGSDDITSILEAIVDQYKDTDSDLVSNYERIKLTILEEEKNYSRTLRKAKSYIIKKYGQKIGDELKGVIEISPDDVFMLYATHGLSPTQIESLGFTFNKQQFAEKMEEHQKISRKGVEKRFVGGLADHSQATVKGHTATHLLHQALRDVLGDHVHQTGSNITPQRIRFDFSCDKKLTADEIIKVEKIVNQKIKEDLPVHFEMLIIEEAKKRDAIGLFKEKYGDTVKVYFIGGGSGRPYSVEFCGGPHVDFTGKLKNFSIVKEEGLGKGQRRIYCVVT